MKVMPTAYYSELKAHHLRAGTSKESGSGTPSNSSSRSRGDAWNYEASAEEVLYLHTKLTIKIDYFTQPLQEEANRIGMGKEHAQAVRDGTMLATASLRELEHFRSQKEKAVKAKVELSKTLGVSPEQYFGYFNDRVFTQPQGDGSMNHRGTPSYPLAGYRGEHMFNEGISEAQAGGYGRGVAYNQYGMNPGAASQDTDITMGHAGTQDPPSAKKRKSRCLPAKQAALAEFVAAMRIFDPAFTSSDSLAVGKATLEYARLNPRQSLLYTGPGPGRLIKAAHDNWSCVLGATWPHLRRMFNIPGALKQAKTVFFLACSLTDALEREEAEQEANEGAAAEESLFLPEDEDEE
ncbi:hypothetical protein B0A54_10846 [Friedmanniomyces endolithicus]|uniref:Uncharacterized protein n=1 Tax=Friedmanniomyces endolithicus TaxID=329885 RepID=A0A4U0UVV6_9PEZI|nr:hypothetical protein B0A54_10846 [Friedmanniomyces endolithicus]